MTRGGMGGTMTCGGAFGPAKAYRWPGISGSGRASVAVRPSSPIVCAHAPEPAVMATAPGGRALLNGPVVESWLAEVAAEPGIGSVSAGGAWVVMSRTNTASPTVFRLFIQNRSRWRMTGEPSIRTYGAWPIGSQMPPWVPDATPPPVPASSPCTC